MLNNYLPFIKSKKLLNIDKNAKTVKGQKYGYLTAILYLAVLIYALKLVTAVKKLV